MRRLFSLFVIFALAATSFTNATVAEQPTLKGVGRPGRDGAGETGPVDGATYDRAIAPYVAKARASYPAAKKRFLAGLSAGDTFFVWIRLWKKQTKRNRMHAEDVFVIVETIRDGKVTGRIANIPEIVTNYRRGQSISVPESEIRNWVIVRPDGSEEGNVVGKFLERESKRH
jgi:uncharacterized protein YegJ (DUF2314 family)